jgi:hypothetical protein
MVNKGTIVFALTMMISFGLIFIIPISILSIHFTLSGYDDIDNQFTYSFYSSNSSEIQTLDLNIDVGDIEVRYIEPPVDYLVNVEVNIKMCGTNIAGKSCEDFFDITPELKNTNSTVDFSIEIISDDWFDPSLRKNVNTVVNIRKDVILDIFLILDDGNFEITVPYGVSIGNLRTELSKGNILYDFQWCTIGGNITGITNEGELELKSYNVKYTQNSNWILNNTGGDMNVFISQEKEMGANITATVWVIDGKISIDYIDKSAIIGAWIYFPLLSGSPNPPQEGFDTNYDDEKTWFISFDFPTTNNYNMTFFITNPCPTCRSIYLHSD